MPTRSAPSVRKARISAGVSKLGPGGGEVDAVVQRRAERVGGGVQARAELGVVGVAQAREARPDGPRRSGPVSGLKPSRLMWSVMHDQAARDGSGRSEPAALVRTSSSAPSAFRVRTNAAGSLRSRPAASCASPTTSTCSPSAGSSRPERRGPRGRASRACAPPTTPSCARLHAAADALGTPLHEALLAAPAGFETRPRPRLPHARRRPRRHVDRPGGDRRPPRRAARRPPSPR